MQEYFCSIKKGKKMKKLSLLLVAVIIITLSGCKKNKVELSGAGATFPLPFYNMIFKQYSQKNNTTVSYGGIGSGGGIRSLKDCTVDFAGSDAFLSDDEMSKMKETIHIPTCLGAVVVAYNLPKNPELNLTGEIIADIFMGKITKWNDKRIADINPGTDLPNNDIIVIYRSDGSGTTNVFTDYLSKIDSIWANKIGVGKSVTFPIGIAAKGNPGVAGILNNTKYSIGYVGSEYAFSQNISMAAIQNSNSEFIKPSTESISKAANGDFPEDSRKMITNSSTSGAYPISCLTWIIVYKEQNYGNRSFESAKATKQLLQYILSDEIQAKTEQVHYAQLPANVKENARKSLNTMVYNGKEITIDK